MSKWVHGRAVSDGIVNFVSASSLQKADASSSTGCIRAWAYQYKMGIKEPPSKAMERGIKLHEELEVYLKTGERAQLSSLALSGLHQLPPPGAFDENGNPRIFVEHSMVPVNPATGEEDLAFAPLRLHGVPVLGKLDLMHALGINYGTEDVTDAVEEPGTVEASDHKTTGDMKNAKMAKELPDTVQMAIYGEYVFTVAPETKLVRLSHNYFPERGNARKVSILVDRERLQPTWNHAAAIVASIKHAAAEPNIDLIDANVRACRAYGRDCPARSQCRAAQHNSLASFVGASAADRMLNPNQNPLAFLGEPSPMTAPAPNSLLARLSALSPASAAPSSPAPVVHLPVIPSQAAPVPPTAVIAKVTPATLLSVMPTIPSDVAAEMTRLMGATTLAVEPVVVPPAPIDPIKQIIALIGAHGVGFPTLAGQAAADHAARQGLTITTGAGLAGSGMLAAYTVTETTQLETVLANLNEIAAKAGKATAAEAQGLPTPTPVAAAPTEEPKKERKKRGPNKKKQEAADAVVASGIDTTFDQVKFDSERQTIEVIPDASPEQAIEQIVAKMDAQLAVEPSASFVIGDAPVALSTDDGRYRMDAPATSQAINVYIDCVVEGLTATSLWPRVHEYENIVNQESGAASFKTTDKFGFGKGEHVIGAMLRDAHARGMLAPGNYTLDDAATSIGKAAAEALRDIAHRTGGVYARGVK